MRWKGRNCTHLEQIQMFNNGKKSIAFRDKRYDNPETLIIVVTKSAWRSKYIYSSYVPDNTFSIWHVRCFVWYFFSLVNFRVVCIIFILFQFRREAHMCSYIIWCSFSLVFCRTKKCIVNHAAPRPSLPLLPMIIRRCMHNIEADACLNCAVPVHVEFISACTMCQCKRNEWKKQRWKWKFLLSLHPRIILCTLSPCPVLWFSQRRHSVRLNNLCIFIYLKSWTKLNYPVNGPKLRFHLIWKSALWNDPQLSHCIVSHVVENVWYAMWKSKWYSIFSVCTMCIFFSRLLSLYIFQKSHQWMSHHRQYNQFSLGLSCDLTSRMSKRSHLHSMYHYFIQVRCRCCIRNRHIYVEMKSDCIKSDACTNGIDETRTEFMRTYTIKALEIVNVNFCVWKKKLGRFMLYAIHIRLVHPQYFIHIYAPYKIHPSNPSFTWELVEKWERKKMCWHNFRQRRYEN